MEKTPTLKSIIMSKFGDGTGQSVTTLLLESTSASSKNNYSLIAFKAACPWYGVGKPVEKHPDGYELYADDPYLKEQQAVIIGDIFNDKTYFYYDLPAPYKEATPEANVRYLKAYLTRINLLRHDKNRHNQHSGIVSLTQHLAEKTLKSKLPFTEIDIEEMLLNMVLMASHSDYSTDFPRHRMTWDFPFKLFLRNVKWYSSKAAVSKNIQQYLRDLKAALHETFGSHDYKAKFLQEIKNSIDELLGEETVELFQLHEADTFGKHINAFLKSLPKAEQPAWNELFVFASKLAGRSDPPAKSKETLELLEKVGKSSYRKHFLQWLEWAAESKATEDIEEDYYYLYYRINDYNTDILKGLVFIAVPLLDNELCRTLASFALKECFKGGLLERLGTGCCKALGMAEGACGVAHLIRIRYKVKKTGTRKSIDGIIEKAAKRLGLSKGEIEDLSVSGFGLSEGKFTQAFGKYQVQVMLETPAKAVIHWFNAEGKEQKSIPAEVKDNFGAEVKQLKDTIKQIEETLSAQKERMDRFYLENRSFPFHKWKEFYLNHGLMQFFSRRLIWTFEENGKTQTGTWLDGILTNVQGKPLQALTNNASVKLWHPIEATVAEITAWRNFLETHKIQQPMKQAYREVYLLTAAEVNTNTYSNRFASHILKQNQFTTLARLRDWKYTLILGYDGGGGDSAAERKLLPWGLTAEFWINQLDIADHTNAYSDGGSFLYVGTDQVRFTRDDEAIPLYEVPPLVLSEILRDVDLFVGVSSIGNDPNWTDGGTHREHHDYWQSYSFGNLNESAKVRKEVLEKILPKLKIASKCSMDGKFLKVKGSLRTYKIHLGSGNILMEPNDQYLCIVPGRSLKEADKLFLPFEGDRVLSLVLSKAFLLADDTKITDTTITSQINSK